ncbi:hypothetical protein PQX77_021796 [Marasmius sp. AFHP31]|nr:hypothetical protein PQX77_021796 [Marasmius sp. AFHP31]
MERNVVIQNHNPASGAQNNNNSAGTQNNFVNSFNTAAPNHLEGDLEPIAVAHKTLWEAVMGVGASHTAEQQYERGECLEGTREVVIQAIHEWRRSKTSLPMCWLLGAAGVGKSAIAMTVARSCEQDGLVASFFFFRSDPRRDNPSALMLTIAHGLSINMPSARALINQRIAKDPTILEARMEDQFQELVLDPSMRRRWWRRLLAKLLPNSFPKDPDLVIIDGLDECTDEGAQQRILSTILSAYKQCPRSDLRFLICSRPESWLRKAFDAKPLHRVTRRIVLDDDFLPSRDIERYYAHAFQVICTDPEYARVSFSDPWPSPEDFECLVQKSSGQFIYAATTVRFIKLAHSNPITQLEIILNYTPEDRSSHSSLSRLDELYLVILSINPFRERMLAILAAIVILPPTAPPSPSFIELLLELPAGEVDLSLRSLHSVLNIRGGDVTITVYHTSFTDFLLDSSRSGQFYIDRAARHEALACQWLRTLDKCVQANPSIILDPNYSARPTSNVRRLLETWVSFCLIARRPTGEVLVRRDNLLQSMLSILPHQQELLTRLASVVLLPTCTVNSGQSRVLRDLIVGPGALRSLERCQLLVPPPEPKLEPFFFEFLSNPSHEYYIDPQEYRNPVAQRWIRALVPTNQLGTDWGSRTLWGGWADFCCSIERPSGELLSDLERLDLTAVAISMAHVYLGHEQFSSIVTRPLEAVISWLKQLACPFPIKLILHFELAVERHRAGFEEIPPEHRPAKSLYYELDCLYFMVLHNANPDHGKVRLILAAILVLPGYLEPTPVHIELLLGLSAEEVDLTLRAMHSVLGIRGSGDAIRLFHTAFREYLIDGTRSRCFHIDIDTQKYTIARQWLQQLSTKGIQSRRHEPSVSIE